MELENSQIIDESTGLVLILGDVAINLFEGYKWYFEDINNSECIASNISAADSEGKEICSILIADAMRDDTEICVSDIMPSNVRKFHNEMSAGLTEAFRSESSHIVSFEESELILKDMRKYLITNYLFNNDNVLYKRKAYRTTVNNKNIVIEVSFKADFEYTISDKLLEMMDDIRFIDNEHDEEYLNKFDFVKQTINVEGFYIPATIRGFSRDDGIIDYEKDTPGLGFSIAFSTIIGRATVYIYNLGRNEISSDMSDPVNESQFKDSLSDVYASYNNHEHIDIEFERAYSFGNDHVEIACGLFSITESGSVTPSFVYMTVINDYYIKIRLTLDISLTEDSVEIANDFSGDLIQYLIGNNLSCIKSLELLDRT